MLHTSRISFDLLTLEVLPLPFDLVRFFMNLGPSQRRCAQWQISRVHNIADIEVVCQVSTLVVGTHIYTVASLANYAMYIKMQPGT